MNIHLSLLRCCFPALCKCTCLFYIADEFGHLSPFYREISLSQLNVLSTVNEVIHAYVLTNVTLTSV